MGHGQTVHMRARDYMAKNARPSYIDDSRIITNIVKKAFYNGYDKKLKDNIEDRFDELDLNEKDETDFLELIYGAYAEGQKQRKFNDWYNKHSTKLERNAYSYEEQWLQKSESRNSLRLKFLEMLFNKPCDEIEYEKSRTIYE